MSLFEVISEGWLGTLIMLSYVFFLVAANKLAEQKKRATQTVDWLILLVPPIMLFALLFMSESEIDRNEPRSLLNFAVGIIILILMMVLL